ACVARAVAAFVTPAGLPEWVALPVRTLISLGVAGSGMMSGIAVALLLCAPILDKLSCRIEGLVRGEVATSGRGLRWEMWQSLHGGLYFVLISPGIFLLELVPFVGPVLGSLWGAHAL